MFRKLPKILLRGALFAGWCAGLTPAAAATPPAPPPVSPLGVVFESEELRIYHAVRPDGRRAMVLTNLDEAGQRLGGPGPAPYRAPDRADRQAENAGSRSHDEISTPADSTDGGAPPAVQVIVNNGDGTTDPVDSGAVKVQPSSDGTTIVINIDAGASRAQAPVVYTPFAPIAVVSGVRGPVRYPDHHHFLGYGHDISSPGLFGGLGLNAGNGYGIGNRPCGNGFDCMLGPQRDHP